MRTFHNTQRKHMRRIAAVAFALVLVFGAGLPALSQEQEAPFVAELARSLRAEGWSEEAVDELVGAAQELDWEGTERADPEVVALALQLGKVEDPEAEPLEQAQMALELALTAVAMESAGFDERSVASVALNGVRDMISDIQAWKSGEKEGNLGEIIRRRLGAEVSTAGRNQAKEKARAGAGEHSGGASESGFDKIPSGSSTSDDGYSGYAR